MKITTKTAMAIRRLQGNGFAMNSIGYGYGKANL
nr:MAG TPA: hypothetical protein [Caudoviricetes sp.]DAS07828.1 MAG TPA: hypothetical protein [Caudoviricetes sp.]